MEHLSWSHKLFLRVNAMVGNRPWLDRLMYVSAHWLIYPLYAVAMLAVAVNALPGTPGLFKEYVLVLGAALVPAYVISYGIAFFFPHVRPVKEFPQIKELVAPFPLWKSFPSDHTIAVTILSIVTAFFLPFGATTLLLFCLALLVALGRVYVGVHYPRDIVGGLVVGSAMALGVAQLANLW